jgi:hypothetical protein
MRIAIALLLSILFILPCNAQKTDVDAVINSVINTLGGREKLLTVNSIKKSGNIEFGGQKIPFNYYAINKKAQRTEFIFSGMTGYFIITKDSGFNFNPFQGQTSPENVTAEDLKLAQDDLDLQTVLVDYKSKGYTIDLLENEDVDGVDAFQLKITISPNKTLFYFIDPSGYYIIRIKTVTISNGQQNVGSTDYYNFKKTKEGILYAYTFDNVTFDSIEINIPLDDKLFRPTK